MHAVKSVLAYFVALAILTGVTYVLTLVVMRFWGAFVAVAGP